MKKTCLKASMIGTPLIHSEGASSMLTTQRKSFFVAWIFSFVGD
jgi:hypothetical protein